jgi:hypothetical protein
MPFGFCYTLLSPIYTFISVRPLLYWVSSHRPSLPPPHTVPPFAGSYTMEATPSPLCGFLSAGGYFKNWYSLLPSIKPLNHYLYTTIQSIIANIEVSSSDLHFAIIIPPSPDSSCFLYTLHSITLSILHYILLPFLLCIQYRGFIYDVFYDIQKWVTYREMSHISRNEWDIHISDS